MQQNTLTLKIARPACLEAGVLFSAKQPSAAQRRSAISCGCAASIRSRNASSSAAEGGNSSRRIAHPVTRFYSSSHKGDKRGAWPLASHSCDLLAGWQRVPMAYQYNRTAVSFCKSHSNSQNAVATEYVGQPEVVRRRRFKLTHTALFGG